MLDTGKWSETSNQTPLPLTDAALAQIERELRARREELLRGSARLEAAATRLEREGLGADDVLLAQTRETQTILRGELNQTTVALARLATGAYGICEQCGEPISALRLRIVPSAAHCDACAQGLDARPRSR